MATELKGTTNFQLTQFAGGESRGRCLQLTDKRRNNRSGGTWQADFVQLTKEDAVDLILAFTEWVTDRRPTDNEAWENGANPSDLI